MELQNPFKPKRYKALLKSPDASYTVAEELWKWEAFYKDGTVLRQFDGDSGMFHSMLEINQAQLKVLRIISRAIDNSYTLLLPDEPFKLYIKHYRTRLEIGTANDTGWFTKFVFGYEVLKTGNKSFLVVLPNNEAVVTDNFNKVIIEP